jgi:SAM-dependent methyltransferase
MTAPRLFDTAALALRRARAARAPADFLLRHVAVDLSDRLALIKRRFADAVDVEALSPLLAEVIAPALDSPCRPVALGQDGGLALPPASLDLVVSALSLQFVNDLPGLFAQVRHALRPDGLFLAALAGGATLQELRQAFTAAEIEVEGGVSPRVAPFADVRDMGALLQRAGLALPVTDTEILTVRYDNAFALMADLRAMGATNVLAERRRSFTRRGTLLRMAEIYQQRFADADGRIRATFEIIWISGWAPDESQQKPLKPGSAKMRLAEALGVPEPKD